MVITMQGLNAFLNMRLRLIFLKSTLDTLKVSNYLKTCSASFHQSIECLIPALHPELLSGGVENQQLQQHMI